MESNLTGKQQFYHSESLTKKTPKYVLQDEDMIPEGRSDGEETASKIMFKQVDVLFKVYIK